MNSNIIFSIQAFMKSDVFHTTKKSIFQSIEFFQVLEKTNNHFPFFTVVENENGEIIACLLAVIQKEHKGFVGKFSSRSIIIGRPIVQNNDLIILDELLGAFNKYISKKAIYSQFRNLDEYSLEEKKVFKKNGFCYEPHLDIIHDLDISIDKQFKGLHKGRRKNIRRSVRAEVVFREVKEEKEFNKAYNLVVSTYNRVELPMPDRSLFEESYLQLSDLNILKTFVAVSNEEIIGCRMVLCYGDLIYDWYAGASEKHLDMYPNDFLPWKVMEWGSQNGYKYFDFGGAGKPDKPYGVRDHKLKFGGDLVEYGRFEKIHNRLLMRVGEIGLKLYKFVK
ncbi:MAG: lipid II:glycine glycyltransferase (peptidoglycan interpeptide bridge formation enzyme) [Polaribacter sp.]|jgi:lipid II:glycine glycyltransferase (peptidoglycan interpeptide bridge formation enzyme)